MKDKKLKRAFTLVELVIVIAVLAILALVVVPSFSIMTKNADISTDGDEVLSLNFALAMYESDYGIYSEQDLKKAIDASKGKNAFDNLQPISAKYGYHYWYKISTNKIMLATTREIIEIANSESGLRRDGNLFYYHESAIFGETKTFKAESLRSKLIDGYILLDRFGSDVAVGLSEIEDIINGKSANVKNSYQLAINNFYSLDKGESKDGALQSKLTTDFLEKTAIVTNDGTLRYAGLHQVDDFIFQNGITQTSSNLYYYQPIGINEYRVLSKDLNPDKQNPTSMQEEDVENNAVISTLQNQNYDLPATVSQVQTNSLWFNMASETKVVLNTVFTKKEDLVGVFAPAGTNAEIYLEKEGKIYTIEENKLICNGDVVAYLGEINAVTDFKLKVDGEYDQNKIKLVDNGAGGYKLYVAGEVQSLKLSAYDLVLEEPLEPATTDTVIFTGDDSSVITATASGELGVVLPKAGQPYTATINATALAGGLTKSVSVEVIRVDSASLTLGEMQLEINSSGSESLIFDYEDEQFSELVFGDLTNVQNNTSTNVLILDTTLEIIKVSANAGVEIQTEGGTSSKKIVIDPEIEDDRTITFKVKVGVYLEKTFVLTVKDCRISTFENLLENEKYLYRVGNANAIKLGSLFDINPEIEGVTLTVADAIFDVDHNLQTATANGFKADYNQNVTAGENYKNDTIKFSGTGIAKLTLTYNVVHKLELFVEVVNATNVTQYSELKNQNSVLLNDIQMSSGSAYYLSNATLYGNGFTFDVTKGKSVAKNKVSENYVITLASATLNNVKVVGAVYPQYGVTTSDSYNNALVYSVGNSVIANCYLSNCATPLRVNGGNLYVTDTTLKGGTFCNLDIRNNSVVTVNNLTTINQADSNDAYVDAGGNEIVPVGLGITFYYENLSENAKLNVTGTLKQYNHICEADADAIKERYKGNANISDNLGAMIDKIFGSGFEKFQSEKSGVKWVNTGILVLNDKIDLDGDVEGVDDRIVFANDVVSKSVYVGENISHTFIQNIINGDYSRNGYLYAPSKLVELKSAPEYQTVGQYEIKPECEFVHQEQEDENGRSYYDKDLNKIVIFVNQDKTFAFKPSVLNLYKFGNKLDYVVEVNTLVENGYTVDIENDVINFTKAGDYRLVYSFSDNFNYNFALAPYEKQYENELVVDVKVISSTAMSATFDFNGESASLKLIDGKNYVMPEDGLNSVMVAGETVYSVTVPMEMGDKGLIGWHAYFPVFGGAISIGDNGAVYDYNSQFMPEGLSVVGDPETLFKYQSASSASSVPEFVETLNMLCFKSPQISANRDAYKTTVEYVYTDGKGSVYHYFVTYTAEPQTFNSCFTANTLITLANGMQKPVCELEKGDEILTWDFMSGGFIQKEIALLINHGKSRYNVVNLTFNSGKTLEIIGEHGVFDYDLNRFVYLSENNANEYIGHNFVEYDNNGGYKLSKLASVSVSEKITEAYSITSCQNSNALASGMLTLAPPIDFYNWIEMGEKLLYDSEKFERDVKNYGLYTYESFKHLVTYEQFIAFNGAYLKIPVEKGLFSFNYIVELIESYLKHN